MHLMFLKNIRLRHITVILVEYIINRDKTGMCPMEKAVLEVDEPNTAYDVLKKKIDEMRKDGH